MLLRFKIRYCFVLLLSLLSAFGYAQTGPGGVGSTAGSSGQPQNVLWVDASNLGLVNDDDVNNWADQSGNGNDLQQLATKNLPIFRNDGLASGNYPVVRFDGTERYLSLTDNSTISGLPGVSIFIVYQASTLGGARGIVSKRLSSSSNEEYSVFSHTSNYLNFDINTGSDSRSNTSPTSVSTGTDYIFSAIYGNSSKSMYLQSVQAGTSQTKTGTISNGTAPLLIGALNESYGTYFAGDIAEIIIYGQGLNAAQRLLVENYLAQKYNIVITNDYYSGAGSGYDLDLAGVGNSSGETHNEAQSDGLTLGIYDGSFSTGEFAMFAHNGHVASIVSDSLSGNISMQERWSKAWYIDKTGSVNVSMAFDFGDVIGGLYPQTVTDYRLIRRNGADYEEVTTASVYVSDDKLIFNVEDLNFSDGYYSIATVDNITAPLDGGAQKVWYSFKNGNWQDPLSWTLDGASTPLYLNPTNGIPSGSDKVVITSGKTISMLITDGSADFNNAAVSNMDVIGILDLGSSYGHTITELKGTGKIRLRGSSVTDEINFVSGDISNFISSDGGVLEIYGNGLDIVSDATFNDLIVNLEADTDISVLTANLTLNGNLTVNSGVFQINDNTAANNLNVVLNGDLYVASSGGISTGTGNSRHQFDFFGNFVNDGAVAFTQRTTAIPASEATDGIVDANFINDSKDQSIQCNNVTHFYRIEINKGEDDTYSLEILSEDASYFNLNGYAAQGHGNTDQLTSNSNALGLLKGTVKIGSNVTIGALNTGGNYNISVAARLWVDGGNVTKSGGTAIVPYGGIVVSGGQLTSSVASGITTRGNGYLTVTGGKVLMNQFRTSIFGAVNQGGYSQSGGEVYVSGGSTSTDYYSFSSTYEGNTFAMSGGVLTINANSRGGIFINGTPGNFNVSGGEVVCELDNNNDFLLTSAAPFYNLTVRKTTSNSGFVILGGGTSANGSSDPRTLAPQDLYVLGNLTLQNSSASFVDFNGNTTTTGYQSIFNANGVDMYLSGNLIEQTGAQLTLGANTVTFQGAGTNLASFDPASSQLFNNVTIDKNLFEHGLRITGGNATSAMQITGELRLEKGKVFHQIYHVESLGNIYLADTVGIAGSTGSVIMNGAAPQTISTDGNGAFYNLEIDNTNGVSMEGDLSIEALFTLTNGVFDINTDHLTLKEAVAGSGFSTTKMIQTNGNSSDEGLTIYIDGVSATETILFPIGTDINTVRYTPVTASLSGIDNDGYITLRVSDTELQTVDLSVLSNNLLTYYWRISHIGFEDGSIPNVDSYVFTSSDSDDPDGGATPAGFDSNFVPGKVLDELPYLRSQETSGGISGFEITFDGAGSGFALENANYTAGDGTTSLFTGAPTIYYSRSVDGNWWEWQETNHWSTDQTNQHIGPPAGSYPQNGDIAVVGSDFVNALTGGTYSLSGTGRHQIRIDNTVGNITVAEIIFDSQAGGTALNVTDMSRVRVSRNITLTAGKISGTGEMVQDIGSTPALTGTIIADLGEFVKDENNGWFFWFQSAANLTISDRFEYPIFRTFGLSGTLDFSQDVTAKGAVIDNSTSLAVTNDYFIEGQVLIGSNGEGTLKFADVGSNLTFECGSLVFSNNVGNNVAVENAGTDIHKLIVNEDITLNQGTGFNLTSVSGAQVILELKGTGSHSFTNNTSSVAELYRLIMNKGTDTTSSFTFNDDFNLNGSVATSTADSLAMVIQNGKLILDNSGIDVHLTNGGADFEIPASGGLDIKQGTLRVAGDDSGIILDGLLRVSGGALNMDDAVNNGNNYIEYSSSGSAIFEISSGSLTLGSQFRRSLTSASGIIKYRQSGGTVIVGQNAAPQTTRGVFEVLGVGSEFYFTGGTFTLVRGINSTTVPSLLTEPENYDFAGSTIVIGNSDTPAGTASSQIGIKSSIPLFNLTVNNDSGNDPVVWLYARPLTLDGDFNLSSGASFNSNGLNVILNGDFVNDGNYIPNSNTTTFSATTGTQIYSGAGSATFYNLVKSGGGTVNLSQDIAVGNDFQVLEGIFDHGSSAINVDGDVTIEGSLQTSGGSGVVFGGSGIQQLIGKGNTDINLGRITIANIEGVQIPDGNGYSFTITDALRLSQGVFDIGGSLLTLGKDAIIEELNTFAVTNMIQTNSSFSDNGVKKIFNGTESAFTFPVGESKYTPLIFTTITTIDEDGFVIVRPANESHPSITDDILTADDETQNTLRYHWVVKSSGITNTAVGTAQFIYDQADVMLSGSNTENDYIAARLSYENYQWDKAYAGTAVDPVANTLSFPLDESVNFAGEYTAGIDNAFRDIPLYRTNGNVNFMSATNWEVSLNGGVDWAAASSVPLGAIVTVRDGDEMTIDDNNVRLLSTTIESTGRLIIDPAYFGTRLGEVSGTGTLVLQNEIFPSGNYENFLTCMGGAIEYSSSNSYPILAGISNVRAMSLIGSGTRTLPANIVQVCENLTIDGPTLVKNNSSSVLIEGNLELISGEVQISSSDSNIEIDGDLILSGGTFSGFSGADIYVGGDFTIAGGVFSPNNADFFFDGVDLQVITGTFNLRNLEINNTGVGIDLSGTGNIVIGGTLNLLDGIVTTTASNKITIGTNGSYSSASSASYIDGPVTKNSLAASANYTFPVGKGGRYAPVVISNISTGSQDWTAEYFTTIISGTPTTGAFDNSDPGSGYNALSKIQQNDRWSLASSGTNSGFVSVTYGGHNAFPNTDEIRVVWWDAAESRWENQGGTVTGNVSSGIVKTANIIGFSTQQFALGNAPESVLPVTYTYFTGEIQENHAILRWQTATEIGNDYFLIQKSVDGRKFEDVGSVKGNGDSKVLIDYYFTDTKPYAGISYYRLKQVDFDGNFEYSSLVVILNESKQTFESSVYPNPVTIDNFNLVLETSDLQTPIRIQIISLEGKRWSDELLNVEENQAVYQIDVNRDMPAGIYLLFTTQGNNSNVKRIVVH